MSDMAWPEKHCVRQHGHAPHTWKPASRQSEWFFCNGMGEAMEESPGKLPEKRCDSEWWPHSEHHWGVQPNSFWCGGKADVEGLREEFAASATGTIASFGGGGGGSVSLFALEAAIAADGPEKMDCGSFKPHASHPHAGFAPYGTREVSYLCEGKPEYEHPPLAESTQHIVTKLLPALADKVIRDARHYGGTNHRDLGQRGQFVEINGKIGPLRRVLWEGHETVREDVREIALDLIGHCLLLVEMIDHGVSVDGS